LQLADSFIGAAGIEAGRRRWRVYYEWKIDYTTVRPVARGEGMRERDAATTKAITTPGCIQKTVSAARETTGARFLFETRRLCAGSGARDATCVRPWPDLD